MSSSIISEESIDLKADGSLDSFDGEMVLPEMDAKQLKTHAAGIVKLNSYCEFLSTFS